MHWWVWVCVHDTDNEQTFRSWPHRSSNHLDKWSRRRTLCSTHVSNCTGHRHYIIAFENSTNSAYITMVLGQPAGLSKEVFVHRGWLDKALLSVTGWTAVKCVQATTCMYWAGQAGFLTPLSFIWHHLIPLDVLLPVRTFSTQWQWTREVYSANFKRHFWRPVVKVCLATCKNLRLIPHRYQETHFFHAFAIIWSAEKLCKDSSFFFSFCYPTSPFPYNSCKRNNIGICTASQF